MRSRPTEAPADRGPGLLYVVSTPIGNLEDISQRALRVLREADLIACEDTRVTRTLLNRYGIGTRSTSYHERNRERAAPGILKRLAAGASVALVTDAGTPGVSDPAAHLVGLAAAEGVTVLPVPGPSAPLAALAASGLPASRFLFEGFLPRKGKGRRERLARLAREPWTIVLFESPPRTAATLAELAEVLGPRRAVLGREITKRFEEFVRGTLPELADRYAAAAPRGEIVIVIEGAGEGASPPDPARPDPLERVRELIAAGTKPSQAVAQTAREQHLSRRALYSLYLAEK